MAKEDREEKERRKGEKRNRRDGQKEGKNTGLVWSGLGSIPLAGLGDDSRI